MVVIPDFATGAMENWGLITFRETAILYDPIETSTSAHQWVAIVIAHELAHQVISQAEIAPIIILIINSCFSGLEI